MNTNDLKIKVLCFASYADLFGKGEFELNVPKGSSIADVHDLLIKDYAKSKNKNSTSLYALNQTLVNSETIVNDNDEVAIMPFVSGG